MLRACFDVLVGGGDGWHELGGSTAIMIKPLRCRTDNKVDFVAYTAKKRGKGKQLLRRTQFDKALSGNVVMLMRMAHNT